MCANIEIGQFLIKIWNVVEGQLKHLRRPKPLLEQLKNARAALMAKAVDINRKISQAERNGQIPTNEIQQWKSEVEQVEGKADKTERDIDHWRCLAGCSWNCFLVNRRVAKRLEDIDKLMTRAGVTPVATEPPPPAVMHIPSSNSALGMEAHMRKILSHVAGASAGVIGIYGMGGVGKTTLLRNINNHRDVAVFDHVIWAVASKECKMERLQIDIAKKLKLRKDDNSKEDRAATLFNSEEDGTARLFNFLKNKDCLLLLDDVWEPLDLAKLGMVHTSSGQGEQQKRKVVVFTTRNEHVCGCMKVSMKRDIKCLEPNQAWELFRRNAGEDAIGSDPGINNIAHQIAGECAGLPLALVTVGMAMSTKKSWEAWNDALTLMKQSQMPEVTTGKKKTDPMFSAFKLSYDYLEDDNIRGCLLSCAMWPEDFLINKDELIECWMGLGLINEVGAIHKAYNRGHSYIENLKAACLLESDNDTELAVKMHDVIRDMALWMASDCGVNKFKWIIKAQDATRQALEEEARHETERVSLMCNDDIESLPNRLSSCSKLSVLMLWYNMKLEEIPGSLIQAMRALTYLNLMLPGIREIPKEIGMLSQLQHLNLSSTSITELPAELGCLVKLKYLLLRDTYDLITVAKGAISNLSSLKLLDLRGSRYNNCWDELESSKRCQIYIGIEISTAASLQRWCSLAHVSAWRLIVQILNNSHNLNQLLDDIMMGRNIRQSMDKLVIRHVNMDALLISKGNEEAGGFECLKYLELSFLERLEKITWKGVQPQRVFPNLREMRINICPCLRNVHWILQLPSLSNLKIINCEAMEELITDEGNTGSSSFGLRRMELYGLTKLKRISPRPMYFPYLEELEVRICPLLRKLPFDNRISENNKLKVIRCRQIWWDNLEWEEVSIKHSLSSLVRREE